MGRADGSDQSDRRFSNERQFSNLTGSPHPHLNHGESMISVEFEESFGNADFVIKIGLGFQDRTELSQQRRNEFFSRGFAHRSCNRNHGNIKLSPPPTSDRLIGFQGVLNH